jgi:uncharacterized oxidoreductase
MSNRLGQNLTVLLTGGTSGIGAAMLRRLLAEGHRCVVVARRAGGLAAHPRLVPVEADLADAPGVVRVFAEVAAAHPDLRMVINNAAVQHAVALTDGLSTSAMLAEEVHVNLLAPAVAIQALAPVLVANGPSAIVNVSSGLAFFPKQAGGLYAATKAGLHSLSQSVRWQLEGRGVSVTEAILPLVDTPMTAGRGASGMRPETVAEAILDAAFAGRPEVWVGKARLVPVLARLAPGLGRWIMRRT